MSRQEKKGILSALFVALLVITNLMGTKITSIGGIQFSVALFAFPFTFLITDIIAEVEGKASAYALVQSAFIALIFVLLMTTLFVALPFADRSFVQSEYTTIFSASIRILIASVIAFYLSQRHDVIAFAFWKKKTTGKHLWLRNNLSTMVSQFIDTSIFYIIAFLYIPFLPSFLNTSPTYTFAFVMQLLAPYYVLKLVVALFDTPLCYVGVRWFRKEPS